MKHTIKSLMLVLGHAYVIVSVRFLHIYYILQMFFIHSNHLIHNKHT